MPVGAFARSIMKTDPKNALAITVNALQNPLDRGVHAVDGQVSLPFSEPEQEILAVFWMSLWADLLKRSYDHASTPAASIIFSALRLISQSVSR
jgi:hypothetical protein